MNIPVDFTNGIADASKRKAWGTMIVATMNFAPGKNRLGTFFKKFAWVTTLVIGLFPIFPEANAQLPQPTRVRIGLAGRNFSFLPFFVAEQQKFFEQEGIRAEMI